MNSDIATESTLDPIENYIDLSALAITSATKPQPAAVEQPVAVEQPPVTLPKPRYSREQRKIAKALLQFLTKPRFNYAIELREGRYAFLEYGLVDPYLSRLCVKGEPCHYPRELWKRHLNRKPGEWWAAIKPLRLRDVLCHLFESYARIYTVGPSGAWADHLLCCIDIDDKGHKGDATVLLNRLYTLMPVLKTHSYAEVSPGGFGIHVHLLLDHRDTFKAYVNDVLNALSRYLQKVLKPDEDGAKIDGIKSTCSWYTRQWDQQAWVSFREPACQGTMCSAPRPTTMEDMDRLAGLQPLPLIRLIDVLPVNWQEEELANSFEPDDKQEVVVKQGTQNIEYSPHGSYNICLPNRSNPTRESLDKIKSISNGLQRKNACCRHLARALGRIPSLDELSKYYEQHGMVKNLSKRNSVRLRDLRKAIKFCAKTFKRSLSTNGFNLDDYAFIDTIDLTPVADLVRKSGLRRQHVLDLVKAFVHLAEHPVTEPTRYQFTIGVTQLKAFAKKVGLSVKTNGIIAARQIAVAVGLVDILASYQAGQKGYGTGTSTRYVITPSHPRFQAYINEYWSLIEPYRQNQMLAPNVMPSATNTPTSTQLTGDEHQDLPMARTCPTAS